METILLYLDDFSLLACDSRVTAVTRENEKAIVVLDQTVFYPQGGGQPYDTGVIESPSGRFVVEEVRWTNGIVRHIGHFDGNTEIGNGVSAWKPRFQVVCRVDAERRLLHSRIHSAGHLVDKAIYELGLNWKPGKGYHFPNGPYDEYGGSLEGMDREKLKADIENLCNGYIQKGGKTEVVYMTREKMKEVCHYVPDFPESKGALARIVVHDGYYMPCGGTPVSDMAEIGRITIRKIKQEGAKIRVGYDVAPQ